MSRFDEDRIQVHPTGLSLFTDCGEAWRRTYIERERERANEFLIVGSALDEAVSADLSSKIHSGQLLPEDDVIAIARDTVSARAKHGKMRRGATLESCLARAEALARYAHRKLCPTIHAKDVQVPWSVRLDDMLRRREVARAEREGDNPDDAAIADLPAIDFVGTMDIRAWFYGEFSDEPTGVEIRDIKSAKASPPAGAANGKHWIQLTSYAFGQWVDAQEMPERVTIDTIVSLKRGVEHRPSFGERDDYDFAALFNRLEQFARALKAGMFLPASPGHWKCSREWCPFYETCPYVKNKRTIDLHVPTAKLVTIAPAY